MNVPNLRQIEMLSQRGETLSIVDLLNANTLSVEMAAHIFCMMRGGASFLTAARPGNAGKTTVMACALMFLPPEVRIETVSDPSVIAQASMDTGREETCYLCHEIGNGSWYGYLWGRDVGDYFRLINEHRSVASCIHADTLDEMRGILLSDTLGVAEESFNKLDFILFMHLGRQGWDYVRRISAFYEAVDAPSGGSENYRLLFTWDRATDTFRRHAPSQRVRDLLRNRGMSEEDIDDRLTECEDFLMTLQEQGDTDYRSVYKQIAAHYR